MNDTASSEKNFPYSVLEGVGWLLLAVLAYIYTFQFDDPLPVYELGPAHWPRMILVIMLIAGARLLYTRIQQYRQGIEAKGSESLQELMEEISSTTRVRVILLFLLPIIYTFLIHRMGFLLITPFFLIGYMWLMGLRRWLTLIVVTVSLYVAIVLVFVKFIFTYLPPGAGVFNTLNGIFLGLIM